MIYHSSKTEEVVSFLQVDENKGLPTGVADQRLEEYGKNIISNNQKVSLREIIVSQFKNHINIFLFISAVLSLIVNLVYNRQNWYSPILISLILCINIGITVLFKKRNSTIGNSLKTMNSPKVKVLRDSMVKTIDASLVVPGDILVLEIGDYVVADARLISTTDFRCNESFVTGEDITAEKNATLVFDDITPVEQRANMVYSGSSVITGHARAIVTETGMNTEVGKTVTLYETYNTDSSLQEKLTGFGKILSNIICVLCFIVFLISVFLNINSGEKFAVVLIDSIINSVVLLVSILPDGLPVTASAAIGYAIDRLVKKGLIIKDMSVFDVLPQVSVICSDKTGTLTQDNMKVESVFNGKEIIEVDSAYTDNASLMILRLATLCTCQTKDDIDSPMYNDATELAIIDSYRNNSPSDFNDIYNHYPCLCKIPFDAERKVTLTVNMIDGVPYAIAKGSPDYLLLVCKTNDTIHTAVNEFAEKGMRVIAVAFRQLSEIPTNLDYAVIDEGMNFAGLISLSDAPQKESIELVEECNSGGIRTVMITGDHAATAKAVARRLGILKDGTDILTGDCLYEMTDEQLASSVENYSVFARLLPDQKLRIVKALKENGHTVSITGDSVNDAQALSFADVGIAMGTKGTDVARGAADIIMNDNRFASIISAINIARGMFCSIRKALTYILSSNIGELLAIILCLLIYGSFPVAAVPMLLINLITDIFPVMSVLSDGVAEHKPMHTFCAEDKATFTARSKITLLIQVLIFSAVSVIAYALGKSGGNDIASTIMFTVLIFAKLFNMATTKFEDFFYKYKHFTNLFSSVVIGIFVIFTSIVVLTPLANTFSLATISFKSFITALLLSSVTFISGELIKFGFSLYEHLYKNK